MPATLYSIPISRIETPNNNAPANAVSPSPLHFSAAGPAWLRCTLDILSRMRFLVPLLATFLVVTGCDRPALQLQFDVPDGYAGILKIRSHHRDGMALRPTN